MAHVSISNESDTINDYSDWMSTLPTNLHDVPLSHLAIPGSHDSFAFKLDVNSDVSPEEPQLIKALAKLLGKTAKEYIRQWSITQTLDFTTQLNAGIRYFDFRISGKTGCSDMFCVHGLYGDSIGDVLVNIKTFLEAHPKEVVILDMNHFYAMDEFTHKQLLSQILEVLGYKMCPHSTASSVTLNTMWQSDLQVIVFYHNEVVQDYAQFWPGGLIPSPWANTMDPSKLISFLESNYKCGRQNDTFYISQGILTPTTKFVMEHLTKSLKTNISSTICTQYVEWLKTKKAGADGINICIMDFVEWAAYIPSVLQLNTNLADLKA